MDVREEVWGGDGPMGIILIWIERCEVSTCGPTEERDS